MLTFDRESQTLEARDEAGKLLWQAELLVEDARGIHSYRATAPGRGRAGGWRLGLEFSSEAGFEIVRVTVAPREIELRRLFLRLAGGKGAAPSLVSGRSKMLGHVDEMRGVYAVKKDHPVSARFFTALQEPGGRALLVGAAELAEDFAFYQTENGCLDAGFEPDRRLHVDTYYALAVAVGSDALDLMDQYGRYLGRFARPRVPSLAGYNSWDYYGMSVTMDDVRREMAAINASRLKGKLSHFVIDMGWWREWGDFQLNARFPGSFRTVAREIAAAGFVPGIWCATLQSSRWAPVGRHRQDLLVPDETGGPVFPGEGSPIMDWSKPEVLGMLYDLFRELRRAGFGYFKLDYIDRACILGMKHRADQTRGPLAVIREGIRTIREAVGEDAYILSCGVPKEASLGYADAFRVGGDIHTFWSHVWTNAHQIVGSLWEHHFWNVDPDFAVIRSAETSDDPFLNYLYTHRPWNSRKDFWMSGPEASFSELRVWLTMVHMSGGEVFLSDSLARLNAKGFAALAKLFPRQETPARPLDLFLNSPPRFWLTGGKRPRLAIFNWEDAPSPMAVPAGMDLPSEGKDVWTGARVRVSERTIMPARSAYLLEV